MRTEWPSMAMEEFTVVAANQILTVAECQAGVTNAPRRTASKSATGADPARGRRPRSVSGWGDQGDEFPAVAAMSGPGSKMCFMAFCGATAADRPR